MKLRLCLLLFVLFSPYGYTQSGEIGEYLDSLKETSKDSCRNLKKLQKKYTSQKRPAEAESVKATMHNICTCMPKQVKKLRSSLGKEQLKRGISERQFLAQFKPLIIDKCAAEQLRFTYGKNCSVRFSQAKNNSPSYCKCMNRYVKKLKDSQISQIGRESSQYQKTANIAIEQGIEAPQKPPSYSRFLAMDERCSG